MYHHYVRRYNTLIYTNTIYIADVEVEVIYTNTIYIADVEVEVMICREHKHTYILICTSYLPTYTQKAEHICMCMWRWSRMEYISTYREGHLYVEHICTYLYTTRYALPSGWLYEMEYISTSYIIATYRGEHLYMHV